MLIPYARIQVAPDQILVRQTLLIFHYRTAATVSLYGTSVEKLIDLRCRSRTGAEGEIEQVFDQAVMRELDEAGKRIQRVYGETLKQLSQPNRT